MISTWHLYQINEGLSSKGGDFSSFPYVSGLGAYREALKDLLLCLASLYGLLVFLVLLGTTLDFEEGGGVSHVSNLDQDALLELLLTHDLVHLNTDTTLGHVEHTASASVVVLVGHTGVHGRVGSDIDYITTLVCVQVGGEAGQTILAEWTRELVTCIAIGARDRRG